MTEEKENLPEFKKLKQKETFDIKTEIEVKLKINQKTKNRPKMG